MCKLIPLLSVIILSACNNNNPASNNSFVTKIDSPANNSSVKSSTTVRPENAVDSAMDFHYYLVPAIPDTDFLTVNENAVIFVYPDSMQIEIMKKEVGDTNFYIGADDANFYFSESYDFLKTKPIKVIVAHNRYIKFETSSKHIFFDTKAKISRGWLVILFRKDALPKMAWASGLEIEYNKYFLEK